VKKLLSEISLDSATVEKLQSWSEKLGVPADILTKQLYSLITHLKSMYPDRTTEFYISRARHLLATKYASRIRVQAMAFTGVFFAKGEKIDYNRQRRASALAIWQEDKHKAISLGVCKEDPATGEPIVIDDRMWLVEPAEGRPGRRNPNYGKPLQPFYQRTLMGIGVKFGEESLKFLSLTLRGKQADLDVDLNVPYDFSANIRGGGEYSYVLTSSVVTEFKKSTNPLFANWSESKTVEALDKAPIKVSPVKLDEYYDKHKQEPIVPCVLEGDLVALREEETATGNYWSQWSDVEEDIELPPVTVFLTKEAYNDVKDLGLGSRCQLVGTLRLGQDLVTGEMTRVNMTALRAFVKYKVSKEESLLEVAESVEWKESV